MSVRNLAIAGIMGLSFFSDGIAIAAETPGKGIKATAIGTTTTNTAFVNRIVETGLRELGFEIGEYKEASTSNMVLAVGMGDADYTAAYWSPLYEAFRQKAGADNMVLLGAMTPGAIQGYLIDKKTADTHKINNLSQLKDPEIAKLFDADGDGKADLAGCNPGWGCERVIEHHLTEYGLRDTVTHHQGEYAAVIAETIARYKEGKPIFYYTWTPQWVSSVLVPGKDTEWLSVPYFSSPDGKPAVNSKLPDGRDLGFEVNLVHVAANKKFADANPAAAKFMECLIVPIEDVNAAMLEVRNGQDKPEDIVKLAENWAAANRPQFDKCLAEARK
ncbi:MAG: glycine betaine/L-proline ABC transporter substrate-binding protein ProX [Parvibaculaceae bacterium]